MYVWVVTQPVSNSSLHSCIHNEQRIFYNNFSVFGQIRKTLNGQNCFEDIAIKYRKTEVNSRPLCMQECRESSERESCIRVQLHAQKQLPKQELIVPRIQPPLHSITDNNIIQPNLRTQDRLKCLRLPYLVTSSSQKTPSPSRNTKKQFSYYKENRQ